MEEYTKNMEGKFHDILKKKIDDFVSFSYDATETFPKSELYGTVSQFRRAAISIMLNYVEGYARRRDKVKLNFYEISHGSSQECKYLLYFAFKRHWIEEAQYTKGLQMIDEIGKMMWSTIDQLEKKIQG